MSDSEDFTVTYTAVSSPFADFPDIGSPGVDGPPVMPEDLYAYVVAAFQAPPSPDYVSGYVPESDPKEDPEEDDDEDPEEDPTDYSVDGGDDGDDEDESSDDDEDEEAPSAEETEPFETDKLRPTHQSHPACRVTTRISIRDETPISLPPREKVERLLAMPTLPLSPLSPWLSSCDDPAESQGRIYFPFIPLLPPFIPSHTQTRCTIIREHTNASYSLLTVRADRPEVTLPPQKRLGIALGPRYEVRESSSTAAAKTYEEVLRVDYCCCTPLDREIMRDLRENVGYGITDTWMIC
ncbi:hypothetical protein Tco_1503882 [Tanacetum coccineum]